MPEEQLLKAETSRTRAKIAETLREAAEEIETRTVTLESETDSRPIDVLGRPPSKWNSSG